ncbi:MAG: thioredoxin family protein [Chthoniobacteraceae bacterium]
MAATPSTMLALDTLAPDFTLPDVTTGKNVSLANFSDKKALLVIFLCAHCPFVIHVKAELARLDRNYAERGVAIVGITANDIASHPQDAPKPTAEFARAAGFNFPILFDETQSVAKAYTAACTPDFFLFGPDRKLAYRGQLDDSRPSRGTSDSADIRAALDAILAGKPVSPNQRPGIGCNIKWKAGNEPDYFCSQSC